MIYKRTFEALKYAKGSKEREELNKSNITSEYQTSHKYARNETLPTGNKVFLTYRTKREAEQAQNKN